MMVSLSLFYSQLAGSVASVCSAPTVAVCSGTAQIVSGSVFSQSRTSLLGVNAVSLFRDSSDCVSLQSSTCRLGVSMVSVYSVIGLIVSVSVFSQSRTSRVINGVSLFSDSSSSVLGLFSDSSDQWCQSIQRNRRAW